MTMRLGQEMVRQALEERDEDLRKKRDKRRYRCKGKQQTGIKTRLGVIEYRRNVYVDNTVAEGNKCVHLLDEELGIERIRQLAKEVCEAVGELVCESSYRAAAKTITENTRMSISPQGVWNIVQKLGENSPNGGVAFHTIHHRFFFFVPRPPFGQAFANEHLTHTLLSYAGSCSCQFSQIGL